MRHARLATALLVLGLVVPNAARGAEPALERGYALMYGLQFEAAEREFVEWQRVHPDNPMAPVSRAANVLFTEFDRLGVLQARLFEDNAAFVSRARPAPDAARAGRFADLVDEAERLATKRLAHDRRDRDALFAMTLANGLRADYLSLVDRRNMAALSFTRQASDWARRLIAAAPDCYDAYLATGISSYLVGQLPLPLRWVLRIGGYQGDKARGVRELTLVASRGRLLGPFARILLAVASLRDNDRAGARVLLVGLARDFPSNPLFARELRRLDGRGD